MLTATARAPQPRSKQGLANPYLARWLEHCENQKTTSGGRMERAARAMSIRGELVKKYSFAIPTEQAVRVIRSYSPLLEVGAGTGYWAWLVRQLGGDILAFDIDPPKREAGPGANRFHGNEGCWTSVETGTEAKISQFPDRTLLMGWPPFQDPLALSALQLYSGQYFLYIGALPLANGWKGPMATDAFLEELRRDWRLRASIRLPNWEMCWDALHIFERRTLREPERHSHSRYIKLSGPGCRRP